MGQSFSCGRLCSILGPADRDANQDAVMLLDIDKSKPEYTPPEVTQHRPDPVKLENPIDTSFNESHKSVAPSGGKPPPKFFKRLDSYLKANGIRAIDVFRALDQDHSKLITFDEIVDGLNYIDFKTSKREKIELLEWMENVIQSDLSFKYFTLALKQRASIDSPKRILKPV